MPRCRVPGTRYLLTLGAEGYYQSYLHARRPGLRDVKKLVCPHTAVGHRDVQTQDRPLLIFEEHRARAPPTTHLLPSEGVPWSSTLTPGASQGLQANGHQFLGVGPSPNTGCSRVEGCEADAQSGARWAVPPPQGQCTRSTVLGPGRPLPRSHRTPCPASPCPCPS